MSTTTSTITDLGRAVQQFSDNHEFIKYYNKYNRELLLQHFLLLSLAGNDVYNENNTTKLTLIEQQDLILVKYLEYVDKLYILFPELNKPNEIELDWWKLMLMSYERKPVSGKSLLRKFKEDTRNVILTVFNCHWYKINNNVNNNNLTINNKLNILRCIIYKETHNANNNKRKLNNDEINNTTTITSNNNDILYTEQFTNDNNWYPKQWYAWLYLGLLGKNLQCFNGQLPSNPTSEIIENTKNHIILTTKAAAEDRKLSAIERNHRRLYNNNDIGNKIPHSTNNRYDNEDYTIIPPLSPNSQRHYYDTNNYIAQLQYYNVQMNRLDKAITLAESFNELEKVMEWKRQLFQHVQNGPPEPPLKHTISNNTNMQIHNNSSNHSMNCNRNNNVNNIVESMSASNTRALDTINNNHSLNNNQQTLLQPMQQPIIQADYQEHIFQDTSGGRILTEGVSQHLQHNNYIISRDITEQMINNNNNNNGYPH